MAVRSDVDWETCDVDGCVGVQLRSGGRCWAHATAKDVDALLKLLSDRGELDGRGVTFTAELLERVLDATREGDEGLPALAVAIFERATFENEANFEGATFKGKANFEGATFKWEANFAGATFKGEANFEGATFEGEANFGGATFTRDAVFRKATFTGDAWFGDATLRYAAWFTDATFTGYAGFSGANFGYAGFGRATFTNAAGFRGATFSGDALFTEATFGGETEFGGVEFPSNVWFYRAIFERSRHLGPMVVPGTLELAGALIRERIQIEVSAAVLSCRQSRFLAGAQLRVRWAQVVLDDADLAGPSVLSGASRFPDLDEVAWLPPAPDIPWPVDPNGTPRLLSVRGADVAGLTVAGVDLRACRFVGAHHLDQLRVEESDFAYAPRGRRWTTRQTIAEEHHWQDEARRDRGWYRQAQRPPDWLEVKEPPSAAQIAAIYRDLRKGREDNKDEPGAADFYFGEMEMRRHAKRQQIRLERRRGHRGTAIAAGTEYAILWLYWLVSGYGLRAWRALVSLAVVVLVASVIFAFWGFAEAAGWSDLRPALIHSAQATTALLRGPDPRRLTDVGEWTQIALRLIGPVLLGLAVLSVRGRVKR